MAYDRDGVDVIHVRVPIVATGPLPHTSMCSLCLLSVPPLLHLIITFCKTQSFLCLSANSSDVQREPCHQPAEMGWQRIDCPVRSYRSVWFSPTVCVHPKQLIISKTLMYYALVTFQWSDYIILENVCCYVSPVYPQAVRVYLSLERECLDKR